MHTSSTQDPTGGGAPGFDSKAARARAQTGKRREAPRYLSPIPRPAAAHELGMLGRGNSRELSRWFAGPAEALERNSQRASRYAARSRPAVVLARTISILRRWFRLDVGRRVGALGGRWDVAPV